jgi:hypothetical protein
MGTLPPAADALYEAADLIALAVSVREALEAGQKGQAAGQAGRLAEKAPASADACTRRWPAKRA